MCYAIPHEDNYWEFIRERTESPARSPCSTGQRTEENHLWLDGLYDAEDEPDYESLDEDDLMEIVAGKTGIEPESATYNNNLFCIDYTFEAAAGYY